MAKNRSVVYSDAATGVTIKLLRSVSGGTTLRDDALALSNADWVNDWEGDLNINGAPAPVVAQYQSVSQQATLVFLCADGTSARIDIPAPKLSIFLSDGVTVDATAITTLIADAVGELLSPSLSPAVSFQSGILGRLPNR